jgi:hypothetical protein
VLEQFKTNSNEAKQRNRIAYLFEITGIEKPNMYIFNNLKMIPQKKVTQNVRYLRIPKVGVEPTWALSPPDFESGAYTNFATPASVANFRY